MIQANWTGRVNAPEASAGSASLPRRLASLSAITLVLLAATSSLQAQTIVAGTPPGQFGVSSGGSASYTIPIPVPPGVAGMQPSLALSYNSQGGSGLVGMGWNLGGLSSITRCPRTKGQDGVHGSVNFDDNDRYCLDGQRLILSSGSYGQANAEYRTEMEGFSKIVSLSRAGNGAASFKVWTKGGQIMEYGNTVDSRIEAAAAPGPTPSWPSSTVRVWALNKITDVKGNYLTVTYDEDTVNGVYRPARIDYAGNATAGTPTHSSVRFNYVALANPIAKFQAGAMSKLVSTLSDVSVYHGEITLVSMTKLTYQSMGATQTPRLSSVQQCDGATSCLSALNVAYVGAAEGFGDKTPWTDSPVGHGQSSGGSTFKSLVDLNGDGLPDFYQTSNSPASVRFNYGSGFSTTATVWPNSPYGHRQMMGETLCLSLVDLNGDGLPDLYQTCNSPATVRFNTGSGFAAIATPWPNSSYGHEQTMGGSLCLSLVDLNGDGLPDLYQTCNSPATVRFNTGSGFDAIAKPWPNSPYDHGQVGDGNVSRSLVDLNGDGLPDLFDTTGYYPPFVRFNTGNGFSDTRTPWANSPTYHGMTSSGLTTVSLVDINGDGLPDLLDTTGYYPPFVRFNTGSGFAATRTPWANSPTYHGMTGGGQTVVSLVDINGDGLPDLFDTTGYYPPYVRFNQSTSPNLLVQVSSATGPTTAISYARLTDPTVYTKDSGANAAVYPNVDLARAASVVSSVASSNGVGGTNTTSYSYGGLKFEAGTGRGMLGFRWVKSKDLSTGLERYTEYRQDFPYTGMAAKSETRLAGSGNGGVLKRTTSTPACNIPQTGVACTVAPDKTYFPFVSSQLEEAWELNGTAYPSSTITVTYSAFPHYGGPTQTSISSTEGWSKTTANEYLAPDTANWIVGRVRKATVTSVKP